MQEAYYCDLRDKKILVTGGSGLIGRALIDRLQSVTSEVFAPDRQTLNLLIKADVVAYIRKVKPDVIIHCAALVGGIEANRTQPSEFIFNNVMMSFNLISAAFDAGVKRLVNLGSSCFYPVMAAQPICEESLLSGLLEPTNQAFATAKIATHQYIQSLYQQYAQDYITVVPANVYGPGDHFDLLRGHVIPAMLFRFKEAKLEKRPSITFWGTGSPVREFIYVDDVAEGIIYCLQHYNDNSPINISGGQTISIKNLAELLASYCQFNGELHWDTTKPDGMPLKSLDNKKISKLGWFPKVKLQQGLALTVNSYL